MTETLAHLQNQISDAFKARGAKLHLSGKLLKAFVVAGGAFVAGVAQFVSWEPGKSPTSAEVVGICATVVVLIGAILTLINDDDAGTHLALAHKAIEEARQAKAQTLGIGAFLSDLDRMVELYQAVGIMRSVLEQASLGSVGDEDAIIRSILKVAGRSLAIAAGFKQTDQWTLCAYRAHPSTDPSKRELRCVDHLRAIECDVGAARRWPEGIGVAGICLSNAREIIVDDLSADSLRSVFQPTGMVQAHDDDRYRSMIAAPILVQGVPGAWGVICATNDQVGHFNHNDDHGLKHEEAIRALAGFVALAVALVAARARAKAPAPVVVI